MGPKMTWRSSCSNSANGQRGFTLLELLVVVFILSAIALMTVSFTGNADDQFRYEDTQTRLDQIRSAAVGQPDRTVNGVPVVSGFLTDIGRLPDDLRDLVENPQVGSPPTPKYPAWSFDAATNSWAGWRGPYVSTLTRRDGIRIFSDGWGLTDTNPPLYGWGTVAVNQASGTMTVQSLGADGDSAAPEDGYAADYPPGAPPPDLVIRDDHQLNIRGWPVTVTFRNPSGGAGPLTLAANSLRVRLSYPQDGSFAWMATWPPDPDNAPSLTLAGPASAVLVPDGGTADVPFSFGTLTDKFVPWGVRSLGVVLDGGSSFPAVDPNTEALIALIPRSQLPPAAIEWRVE